MLWTPFAILLGLAAWLAATFGPLALAITSLEFTKRNRLRLGWMLHLFYLPLALALMWSAAKVLFFAMGDTGDDDTPGAGLAIVPAMLVLVLTVIVYYGTLFVKLVGAALSRGRFV